MKSFVFFPETSRSLSCRSFTADWLKFFKQRSMAMRLLTPCRGCTSSFLPTSTPDSKDFCQFSFSVHSHYLGLHLSCCFVMTSPIISPHSISIPVSPINLALVSPFSLNCLSLHVSPIKGYQQSFRRRCLRSSHHLLSSCRYWAQQCSENRPLVWSTTKKTSVLWTAMRLLCGSRRSGLFQFFLLTMRWWKKWLGLQLQLRGPVHAFSTQ